MKNLKEYICGFNKPQSTSKDVLSEKYERMLELPQFED